MSRVLVVTGMHRSGTSLVANYLSQAGIDMGAELIPADVGNPHGYFEDADIHDLHRELLWRAGIDDGFTVRDSDMPIPVDDESRERARRIAAARADTPQWGWKEPRTALFCDLWTDVLPDATFLFLFRKPVAVLDSLLRRAAQMSVIDDPSLALSIWRIYNTSMLDFSNRHPERCVWVETQDFTRDPRALIDTLRSRFGFELSEVPVDDVVVSNAYHDEVRMRARVLARRNRAELKRCESLYAQLQQRARRPVPASPGRAS